MTRATHAPSHRQGGRTPIVAGMALHRLFNPGSDSLIVDEPGHQADPGHFNGDPDDPTTAELIRSGRVLDQGPAPKKGQ